MAIFTIYDTIALSKLLNDKRGILQKEQIKSSAYIFKAIFAQLSKYVKKSKDRKPSTPENNFFHFLHIHHSKNEYEFVKYEVPKFIFDVLKIT